MLYLLQSQYPKGLSRNLLRSLAGGGCLLCSGDLHNAVTLTCVHMSRIFSMTFHEYSAPPIRLRYTALYINLI